MHNLEAALSLGLRLKDTYNKGFDCRPVTVSRSPEHRIRLMSAAVKQTITKVHFLIQKKCVCTHLQAISNHPSSNASDQSDYFVVRSARVHSGVTQYVALLGASQRSG